MATKLYLLNTANILHKSLTATKSAALPVGTDKTGSPGEALDLGTVAAASQQSAPISTGTSAVLISGRYHTWVSNQLAAQTISAQNWTIAVAASENNAAANQFLAISIAIIDPSTGGVRGYIYDASTALGSEFSTSETGVVATVAGSSVVCSVGDQLIVEVWCRGTQTGTTNRTATVYWNGTTDPTNGGATANAASYIQSTNTLTFFTPAKADTLQDNFDDNSIDAAKWWTWTPDGATVLETGGRIEETPPTSIVDTTELVSQNYYDIVASYAMVRVDQVLAASDTNETWLLLKARNGYWWDYLTMIHILGASQRIEAYDDFNGAGATATYNATTMKWLRIREAAGTIYFEYSATGQAGSWTVLDSKATPIPGPYELHCGVLENLADAAPGKAIFDSFNILQIPPGPQRMTSINQSVKRSNFF